MEPAGQGHRAIACLVFVVPTAMHCTIRCFFARGFDSAKQESICEAIPAMVAQALVIGSCIRGTLDSKSIPGRAGWRAQAAPQGVGFRQGCSLNPLVFRWVLGDILAELHSLRQRQGCEKGGHSVGEDADGRRSAQSGACVQAAAVPVGAGAAERQAGLRTMTP